jgi:hypothetical protein
MSRPQYIRKRLAETGGIAAIRGITPPASTAAYFEGAWAKPEITQPVCMLRLRHRPGSAIQRGLRRLPTRLENAQPGSALLGGPPPPGCRLPCPERRLERPTVGVIATPLAVAKRREQWADYLLYLTQKPLISKENRVQNDGSGSPTEAGEDPLNTVRSPGAAPVAPDVADRHRRRSQGWRSN